MTLPKPSRGLNYTPEELENAALVRFALNNRLADDLAQQISGTYEIYDELVRHEITQLCSHAFEITRALNAGDPQRAYQIACAVDMDGLGRTA